MCYAMLFFSVTFESFVLKKLFSAHRRVHVGDLDVRHQAFPGREEQRCDWPDRERRATGDASSVPAHPLQLDDQMLVIRSQQEAQIHRA